MSRKNKNNKGFSLVELIVVILIMSIISVSLAPQVMKWVGNSQKASDISNFNTLITNCQTALADMNAWEEAQDQILTVTYSGTEIAISGSEDDDVDSIVASLAEVCGGTVNGNKVTGVANISSEGKITITKGVVAASATPAPLD